MLGLRVPLIRMPVAPGRSVAILVEVAARNQLLRARGHHAARLLADRLEQTPARPPVLPSDDDEDEDLEPGGRDEAPTTARRRPRSEPARGVDAKSSGSRSSC